MSEPTQRTETQLLASMRAHRSWANTTDRVARTEPARRGLMARFEREVDPDGTLDPSERARRAEAAKKAHYAKMAHASLVARRKARAAAADAAAADAALAEAQREGA